MWSRDQKPNEPVDDYYADMPRKSREVQTSAGMTQFAIMRGLRPAYRTYVMQQNPTTIAELLEAAKVAEATVDDSPLVTLEILEAINRLVRRITAPVADTRRVQFRRTPSPVRRLLPPPMAGPRFNRAQSSSWQPPPRFYGPSDTSTAPLPLHISDTATRLY